MKLILSILLFTFLKSQMTIKMEKEPKFEELFSVKKILELDGGDEGYYNSIQVFYSDNRYIVYDVGNFECIIYDLEGNEQSRFGKEGNGPGEFSQFSQLIMVHDDVIIFRKWDALHLFDSQGKHLSDIKIQAFDYSITIKNEELILQPLPDKKKDTEIYSMTGKKLKTVKNEVESVKEEDKVLHLDDTKTVLNLVMKPSQWQKIDDSYFRFHQKEYQIDIADDKGIITHILKRPFDRIKLVLDDDWKIISVGDKKKDKELNAKYRNEYMKSMEGFRTDIEQIVGNHGEYLFVKVASEDNRLILIDVIDKNYEYVDRIEIPVPEGSTKVHHVRLNSGKLIGHFKTDDIGPFAIVYDLIGPRS